MMKKYRLIKTYPGSPELGTIIEPSIGSIHLYYNYNKHYHYNKCIDSPMKFPEFWEEIIEYPIGTLVRDTFSNANFIYKKKANYKWICLGSSFVNPIDSIEYTIYDNEIGKNLRYVVVEKDYEILSYYAKNISGKGNDYVDNEYIWLKTSINSDKWSRLGHITSPYTTEEITNHNGYGIHSIKRLSDGEIFTIGDKIENGIIKNIIIEKNKIYLEI
jgi:hypothetical protein